LDFAGTASADELISVIDEPNTRARPDVWTRGRVAALFTKATPEQRKLLEGQMAERLKAAVGRDSPEGLRGFAAVFDTTSGVGRREKVELARRRRARGSTADDLGEAQLHLLQRRAAGEADPSAAGQAVELLAKLMLEKKLLADAAHYYKELGRDFAKVIIRD